MVKTTNNRNGEVTISHEGCVLEVRTFVARRNHSDTLDCSDWRDTNCVEAFVYLGRMRPKDHWEPVSETNPLVERAIWDRFGKVDCSNLFTWRGANTREAFVDENAMENPELAEDFAAFEAWQTAERERMAAVTEAHKVAVAERKAEEEANRPVKGKKMIVVKGRKVPQGFVGTVAFISGSGSVLLKADNEWQDRKAQGTWVPADYLAARV